MRSLKEFLEDEEYRLMRTNILFCIISFLLSYILNNSIWLKEFIKLDTIWDRITFILIMYMVTYLFIAFQKIIDYIANYHIYKEEKNMSTIKRTFKYDIDKDNFIECIEIGNKSGLINEDEKEQIIYWVRKNEFEKSDRLIARTLGRNPLTYEEYCHEMDYSLSEDKFKNDLGINYNQYENMDWNERIEVIDEAYNSNRINKQDYDDYMYAIRILRDDKNE